MKNNELLSKIVDALNIKNEELIEIFDLTDIEITSDEINHMLLEFEEEWLDCDNITLEAFLNGFITFKRGTKETKPGETKKPALAIKDKRSINNVILKKLKIALSLTGDDMIDIFGEADVTVTKRDLSPYFRAEGHKHYKRCNDEFLLQFLSGVSESGMDW